MIQVEDTVVIKAPIAVVFDADRNLDLHIATQVHRGERIIAGRQSGLAELHDEIEWEAVHFCIRQRLRSRIVMMEPPHYFRDEMLRGAFKSLTHEHFLETLPDGTTRKRDLLSLTAPLGPLGWIAERTFLGAYMGRFLRDKNRKLKLIIEQDAPTATR